MRIIFKEPGKPARRMVIDGSLETMQQLVGGYIEHLSAGNGLGILCNEEGKLLGLAPSGCEFMDDPLVGNIIFLGENGEDFTDVPEWAEDFFMNVW